MAPIKDGSIMVVIAIYIQDFLKDVLSLHSQAILDSWALTGFVL